MSIPPSNPKIYHITAIENLQSIISAGYISSDAGVRDANRALAVGMSVIKDRRLCELEVKSRKGTKVGQYVPFYFCPRSVMLYIIKMGNHPDMPYKEGQMRIVHLEADLRESIKWAEGEKRCWAFTDRNAGARYTSFFSKVEHLNKIDWEAVFAEDFRQPAVKEAKQAEFLMYNHFPWFLIRRIGVIDQSIAHEVEKILIQTDHSPAVFVKKNWYY